MSVYSLQDARSSLKERLLWLSRSVVREPLEGLVNGSNKLFHVPYVPAAEDSIVVYNSSGVAQTSADVTTDEASGAVVFNTAPSHACTASYTYQVFSDTALVNLCKQGFDIMQRLYPRTLYIYTTGNTSYVSSTTATASDPACGTKTFYGSRIQQDFLVTCSELALTQAMHAQAAVESVNYREGITGMHVDKTRRPEAFRVMEEQVAKRAEQMAMAAAEDAGDTGSLIEGGVVPGARSDYYTSDFDWWTNSDQYYGIVS